MSWVRVPSPAPQKAHEINENGHQYRWPFDLGLTIIGYSRTYPANRRLPPVRVRSGCESTTRPDAMHTGPEFPGATEGVLSSPSGRVRTASRPGVWPTRDCRSRAVPG